MSNSKPKRILPIIVLAQFAGTSLWFAGNAVVPDLVQELALSKMAVGYITSAVQVGFICGTLLFAFLSVADRLSPSIVFLGCAVLGAAGNTLTAYSSGFGLLMLTRFATGFFLAGIYPVGMKIASDWHKKGLGKALGYLVGALVLGTAFPHLIKYVSADLPWRMILFSTSAFAAIGGIVLYLAVPNGPYQAKKGTFDPTAALTLFKGKNFRSAAFGYFGHMWELYTFWAFVSLMMSFYGKYNGQPQVGGAFWAFAVIAVGALSCAIGGHWALKSSSKRVALVSLIISGLCCLFSPFFFELPFYAFIMLLLCWGVFVVSDSPQFSTMVAESADREYVATGLTIVNSIGFAVTIISIQLINVLWTQWQSPYVFMFLAIGPIFGTVSILKYRVQAQIA